MKHKFKSEGFKFTVKEKPAGNSGCSKCAFRNYGTLCGNAPECHDVYFTIHKITRKGE